MEIVKPMGLQTPYMAVIFVIEANIIGVCMCVCVFSDGARLLFIFHILLLIAHSIADLIFFLGPSFFSALPKLLLLLRLISFISHFHSVDPLDNKYLYCVYRYIIEQSAVNHHSLKSQFAGIYILLCVCVCLHS